MIVEASLPGLLRTLFIIGGVFLLLRFLGQLMIAKRNMEEERRVNKNKSDFKEQKAKARGDIGKTKILRNKKTGQSSIEDVEFEEVD
ncbi:MAG: hypothetical protein KC454_05510 [Flavobacteriales bacterium]|nr:hypothetical protein [Flavobacteriales bacterium]